MRARYLFLLLLLLPLVFASPYKLASTTVRVYDNVDVVKKNFVFHGMMNAFITPAYSAHLEFIDPADVYVIYCGSSCDANYIRSRLLDEFAPGVYINPNIPVYNGYAYVPVFAAVYTLDGADPVMLTVFDGNFMLGTEVVHAGPYEKIIPFNDLHYTTSFRVYFPKHHRDVVLSAFLGFDPDSLFDRSFVGTPAYYLATDGFLIVGGDVGDLFDYRSTEYYEDSCISFNQQEAVRLTPSTQLNLFDCEISSPDEFVPGHNYQTRRYAHLLWGKGQIDMHDINIITFKGRTYFVGTLEVDPDGIDFDVNLPLPKELSAMEKYANLMIGGLAGLTGVLDVYEMLPFLPIGPLGPFEFFLLSAGITYFVLKWTYEYVKKKNPKLLPFYWLMVALFGDTGAIVVAALAFLL